MRAIVDSFKKFYDKKNQTKHIILFLLTAIFTTLSILFDIKTGQPETWKQNCFDLTLNVLIAIYSVQFLHDCFKNPDSAILPFWNNIELKAIPGQIVLSIVWSVYLFIIGLLTIIWFAITNDLILPIIITLLIIAFLPYISYSYIIFAKDFSLIKSLSMIELFKFAKKSYKPTIITYLQYIFASIILFGIYLTLYFIGGLIGLTKVMHISAEYYLFDFFISSVFEYFLNVLLFFMLPYSLLKIYVDISSQPQNKESEEEKEI